MQRRNNLAIGEKHDNLPQHFVGMKKEDRKLENNDRTIETN
jgi:hypothetical protein